VCRLCWQSWVKQRATDGWVCAACGVLLRIYDEALGLASERRLSVLKWQIGSGMARVVLAMSGGVDK